VVLAFGLSGLTFRKPGLAGGDAHGRDRVSFQVIEVPEDTPVERPLEPSNLVSDRMARAADNHLADSEMRLDPYVEGRIDLRELEQAGSEIARTWEDAGLDRQEGPERAEGMDVAEDLIGREVTGYVIQDGHLDHNTVGGSPRRFSNLLSDATRRGGLSFNTYEWDFAPYMLAMKRAIEDHLFPPYAFTHMGLISGTNIIRFVVMPDGGIRSLEILGSDAHFSLDRTSLRAIESSVPFLPLPADFPDEYLEVTAHFSYVVLGRE
jgi:hypothetical protein